MHAAWTLVAALLPFGTCPAWFACHVRSTCAALAIEDGANETHPLAEWAQRRRPAFIYEGRLCMTVEHFHVGDTNYQFWECASLSERELRQLYARQQLMHMSVTTPLCDVQQPH